MARVGEVAYRVQLPDKLKGMHDVFHISMLRKYIYDPSHISNLIEGGLTIILRPSDQVGTDL